jgi:hypothetical protein
MAGTWRLSRPGGSQAWLRMDWTGIAASRGI